MHPGFHIVSPAYIKCLKDFLLYILVINRAGNLYPVIHVPGHPVGRGDIYFWITFVFKNIDSWMFQEFVQNRNSFNIFTLPRDSRYQATYSSNNELYLYTCIACFI